MFRRISIRGLFLRALLKLKIFVGDLLRESAMWTFSVLPETVVRRSLLPLTRLPLIGGATTFGYNKVLRICNYRAASADWLKSSYDMRPSSQRRGFAAAYAALDVWNYDRAKDICAQLKRALVTRVENRKDLGTVLRIELISSLDRSEVEQPIEILCRSQTSLGEFFYKRAWLSHSMRSVTGVQKSLKVYLPAHNFSAPTVEHVINELYRPNGLWADAYWAADRAIGNLDLVLRKERLVDVKRKELQGARDRLNGVRLEMATLCGREDLADYALKQGWKSDPTFLFNQAMHEGMIGNTTGAITTLQSFVSRNVSSNLEKAVAYGKLGLFHEENGEFDTARLYYSEAYRHAGVPFWFPEYLWRYVSLLMAIGDWDEAIYVLRDGISQLWRPFSSLAKTPIRTRMIKNEFVPESGAFFLGCQGIGDDIMRLAVFRELRNSNAKYGWTCDARLKEMFENSIENVEFISNSTVVGRFKVSEQKYIQDRDGVQSNYDPARLTNAVLMKIREYPEVALTEDLFYAFLVERGKFRRKDLSPVLRAPGHAVERVRALLSKLPPGRPNIGISWRSGVRDAFRNKAYSDLNEWGNILDAQRCNFVNLQYEFEQEELDEAKALFGVDIYTLEGIDLRDDLNEVAALCSELDCVITPGTALRELAGAVGARAFSISSTPFYPDLYRIDENERDLIFPTLEHVTAMKYGGRDQVLAEIGRRIKELTSH